MQDARYSSTVSGKLGVEAHRKRALEMLSMRPIVDPVAGDLFHGGDRFSVADDRREVSMAARLDPHTEAGLGIVEGYPLDDAGEHFPIGRG
jgi:hypothetical protein